MIINVMIVDDEYLERILISKSFDWEAHGFKIVGEAESAKQALDLYDVLKPHIIFTDINMPFMDGLEFARQIEEKKLGTKIIIITGYREFEYAKKAVEIGVKSFLLKPIAKEELAKVSLKIKQEIIAEHIKVEQENLLKSQMKEHSEIIIESFFQRLVEGRVSESEFSEKLACYGLEYLNESITCVNIKVEVVANSEEGQKEQEIIRLKESLQQHYKMQIFMHYLGNIILLIARDKTVDKKTFKEKLIDRLTTLKKESTNVLTIAIGDENVGINGIALGYKQSTETLKGIVALGKEKIGQYRDIFILQKQKQTNAGNIDIKLYINALKNRLNEEILKITKAYIKQISCTCLVNIEKMKIMCVNFTSLTLLTLVDLEYKVEEILEEDKLYNAISKIETSQDMEKLLLSFIDKIIQYNVNHKNYIPHKLVEKTKNYIEQHFNECDLSLNTLAKIFYVNDSYLSKKFKDTVGQNITDYILEKRINKAIELLKSTDLKSYQIGEQVGINDPHYFGLCFKKYTGYTSNAYRNLLKTKNNTL